MCAHARAGVTKGLALTSLRKSPWYAKAGTLPFAVRLMVNLSFAATVSLAPGFRYTVALHVKSPAETCISIYYT